MIFLIPQEGFDELGHPSREGKQTDKQKYKHWELQTENATSKVLDWVQLWKHTIKYWEPRARTGQLLLQEQGNVYFPYTNIFFRYIIVKQINLYSQAKKPI